MNTWVPLETETLIDSKEDMTEKCKVAAAAYEGDFDKEDREIADCRMLVEKRKDSAFIILKTPIELFKFAISYKFLNAKPGRMSWLY